MEFNLFSKNHDHLQAFEIDDDEDVIDYVRQHLMNDIGADIFIKEWKYDHHNNAYYGVGKDWLDEQKVDYYILCNAASTMKDVFNAIMDEMPLSNVREIILKSKLYEHSAKSILDKMSGTVNFYDFYTEEDLRTIDSYASKIRKELTLDDNVVWIHQKFGEEVIYQRIMPDNTNPVQVPSDFTKRESDIMLEGFRFLLNKGIRKIERTSGDHILKIHYADDKTTVLNTDEWRF